MATVDEHQVVWEHLTTTGTDLYALVAKRIKGPRPPVGFDPTKKQIVFHVVKNQESPDGVFACEGTFKCYGGGTDDDDARAVADALYSAMQGKRVKTASGTLRLIRCIGMFPGPVDPETGIPCHVAKFSFYID